MTFGINKRKILKYYKLYFVNYNISNGFFQGKIVKILNLRFQTKTNDITSAENNNVICLKLKIAIVHIFFQFQIQIVVI